MAEEKIFTIPLRKEFLKKPKYRRTKKAVTTVKEFITRHLKVEVVNIGSHLNEAIWSKGKRNPPSKIKVKAIVEEKVAYVELPEFEFLKAKPKEEKEDKKESKKKDKDSHEGHNHETSETEKKQEKELNKELGKEDEKKSKKEHHPVEPGTPNNEPVKAEEGKESKSKRGRVVGSTGKK